MTKATSETNKKKVILIEEMLSLCIIVKNEEEQIKDFLEHIQELADEIILVDTGSTDKTKEIAARFSKVKIFQFPWQDDFSKARNESLKHATQSWILVMDPDERLSGKDSEKIKKLIEKEQYDGFALIQRNYTNDSQRRFFVSAYNDQYPESKNYLGWTENKIVRLFKKDPAIFYSYQIHELVEPSIEAKKGKILKTNIPLHHYSAEKEEKLELYQRIAEKKCRENPQDARAWFELGIIALKNKKYDQAIEHFEKTYQLQNKHPFVCAYLIDAYGRKADAEGIIQSYKRGISANPFDINLYLNIGAILTTNKQYLPAKKAYAQALQIDKKNITAWFGLGICCKELGEEDKAKKAFKNVLLLYPQHEKAKELLEELEKEKK